MSVFDRLAGHEEVVYFADPFSGLRAIVAIHSSALGPALGGTRFYPYPTEDDALADVLRLSRGMTYKAAAAQLDLGGGKAVIIGDPKRLRSEELLRAYGRFVESLGGRFVTAEDVGTTAEDMDVVGRETRFVAGLSPAMGGSGDPSPITAYGVYLSMLACAEDRWGEHSVRGRRVAVQGLGKVGYALVKLRSSATSSHRARSAASSTTRPSRSCAAPWWSARRTTSLRAANTAKPWRRRESCMRPTSS